MNSRSLVVTTLFFMLLAGPAWGAGLVNINTADSTTLQTLNGIGPSKAQAIIDYRTQHGPFAAIADIQNVSGIGPTTYANIKDFITVDASGSSQPAADPLPIAASPATTTQVQSQSVGGASPPPIVARITTNAVAVAGAGTIFDGEALGAQGQGLVGARFVWNFGDGAAADGAHVMHTFAYPGSYDVQLSVAYNYSSATARLALSVVEANIALVAEGDGSLTLQNYTGGDVEIGWWSLRQGTSTFTLPEGTAVLANKGVRFAPTTLKFFGDETAALYYPNGAPAAHASVGPNSPLRGQVVDVPAQSPLKKSSGLPSSPQPGSAGQTFSQDSAPSSAAAKPPAGASLSAHTSKTANLSKDAASAAAAAAPLGGIEWSYLVGLTAVIAIGAVGAYYAYEPRSGAETSDPSEEFDIE